MTQRDIASRLGTSYHTVRRQILNIYDKLGIQGKQGGNTCRIQLMLKMNGDAIKPTLTELCQRLNDVTAERDGYRVENRRLREKLGEVSV